MKKTRRTFRNIIYILQSMRRSFERRKTHQRSHFAELGKVLKGFRNRLGLGSNFFGEFGFKDSIAKC